MQTLAQRHHYLSSIRDAQAFISMDPNLLRFPEVVLERIEIKIEDDPTSNTAGKVSLVKPEKDWRPEKTEEKNDAAPILHPDDAEDGAVYPGRGASKEYNEETAPEKSDAAGYGELGSHPLGSGCNGLSKQHGRNSGRRKRGGRHQYVHRDRQQFDRKLKQHCAIYVEEERQRGQRFSEEENQVLVEGVLSFYKELCGYSSLKGSASRKRRLWQEVVNKVNSIGTTYRTIEVCKKRYGDCRRVVKLKMAALENQAMGWGGSHEQIKFNNWEEKLRQKIISVTMNAHSVLDTCKPSSLELYDSSAPSSTPQQCSSWAPTTYNSAAQITQPPMCEPVSDYDETLSPLDIQLISEWSEEEAHCTPAAPVPGEGMSTVEPQPEHQSLAPDSSHITNGPETSISNQQHLLQLQEEHNKSLQHLTQAHNLELHKLRENMVEGNARIVQQLEGLASGVRELNTHVQQIHMNQTHFNHMFQNYITDTKQFYGAIIQAIKSLQPAPTVSPMASPPSSPVSSPKYLAAQTNPNPMLLTAAVFDSTSMSPAGSAEPASASSTASEINPSSRRRGRKPTFKSQTLKKH
ncbi:myb-related transcription factor, partner of profilin-like [Dendropsophus ebraccatus]|uniref:myb-related transcription factor, partner of profilin-like n=1 Tax=Dendropsophus ebraccatus TaxID=150705 RepID=UPI00383126E8